MCPCLQLTPRQWAWPELHRPKLIQALHFSPPVSNLGFRQAVYRSQKSPKCTNSKWADLKQNGCPLYN
ncbi:hypothetical protein CLOSTMETH_00496 [[Clostridium] methylpentosum DSM 5476]|uniref:Uncharacterized protein n=1 Tax=[Clostridium] methylpentosum DSM 5476 TaxID=537013 RepID=C0E9J7_9FIRM|nr:hypothetical protein CLOSTMETH_00496 [[Clostridium] methylpentosum DSM 5476]